MILHNSFFFPSPFDPDVVESFHRQSLVNCHTGGEIYTIRLSQMLHVYNLSLQMIALYIS